MYDEINFEIDCPKCGKPITTFQSKDGPCLLMYELEIWEVDNFYSSCHECEAWIEFTAKNPNKIKNRRKDINDYDMEIK